MATATKNARTARQRAHGSNDKAPMEFRVFEDNDGDYHWVIVAASGATLAQSSPFASYDDAEHAAKSVRDGAASAQLAPRSDDTPALVAA